MKLTKKTLIENKIFNPYDIAEITQEKIFISFTPADTGRIGHSAHWQITGIGFKTDPTEAWYNYGNKTFDIYSRKDKDPQLEEAKTWAKEHYGLEFSERDVWGNWHVTGTMDKLKEIILKGS